MTAPRIFKLGIVEGEPVNIVAQVKGPEGTWLKNTTTGQQGVSSTTLNAYERTSNTSPATLVYQTTLATATIIPYTGTAAGPGITGDGWTDDADGYNLLYIQAGGDTLFTMEGNNVYLYEFVIHRTGATNTMAWGDLVLLVEVSVTPRYSL